MSRVGNRETVLKMPAKTKSKAALDIGLDIGQDAMFRRYAPGGAATRNSMVSAKRNPTAWQLWGPSVV